MLFFPGKGICLWYDGDGGNDEDEISFKSGVTVGWPRGIFSMTNQLFVRGAIMFILGKKCSHKIPKYTCSHPVLRLHLQIEKKKN